MMRLPAYSSMLALALAAAACSPRQSSYDGPGAQGQPFPDRSQRRATEQALAEAGSRYPLVRAQTVWIEQTKLLASDGVAGTQLGAAVALSGDTALVGARWGGGAFSSGSVYAFGRTAATWGEQQEIVASDGAAGDYFGESVSLSEETVLIGAPRHDGVGGDAGGAYVFVRTAATWSEQQKLTASDAASTDGFGESVSLSGDTALVGAQRHDGVGSNEGRAYVFVRTATAWSEQQKLTASDGASYDYFGSSVSLSGDTALIGAPDQDGGGLGSGAAYAFVRTAATWSEQQKLVPSDGAYGDYFGESVSLDADTALIGAYADADADANTGAAYAFVRIAGTWSEQQKLLASDALANRHFGESVSLSGDRALIGALGDDDVGGYVGSAYVFARTATGWSAHQKLTASDWGTYDEFGFSVAISGDTALIGAHLDDELGADSGSAYVAVLKLVVGEGCTSSEACASGFCADGLCCDAACDGPCAACDVVGLEGQCLAAPRSSVPSGICEGYLCNGDSQQCPQVCSGDGECQAAYHCEAAALCLPKVALGDACLGDAGCLSGHCVSGICCSEACDEGCGSCIVAGLEGTCSPLQAGEPGTPDCAPYVCEGKAITCPSGCVDHPACASGNHCAGGQCQPDASLGSSCTDSEACSTRHCTDELCCVADTCGAYRCGAEGVCDKACTSSAQCAAGHQCNSRRQCEERASASAAPEESGACQLGRAPLAPAPASWLLAAAAAMIAMSRRLWARRETQAETGDA